MSEHKLFELKPVVLANDDYQDSDETFVKQLYNDNYFQDGQETHVDETCSQPSSLQCAQRFTSVHNVMVTPRNCVNVTNDNVTDLFDEINCSQSQASACSNLNSLIQLYRELPKDLFIAKVLDDNDTDEKLLYELRRNIFSDLKLRDNFPFPTGTELKRRKNTNRGDSVHTKLSCDIYILISVFEGAPFEELRDLLSSSKYSSKNDPDLSVMAETKTQITDASQNHELEFKLIHNSMASIQADIMALQQDNKTLRDECIKECKSLRNEMKSLKTDTLSDINKIKTTLAECQLSIERVCSDKANGVASLKSDIRQIRSDLISVDETIDVRYSELDKKIFGISKLDKKVTKIEHRLSKMQLTQDTPVPPVHAISISPSPTSHQTSNSVNNSITREPPTSDTTAVIPTTMTKGVKSNVSQPQSDTVKDMRLTLGNTRLYQSPVSHMIKRLPISAVNQDDNDLISFSPAVAKPLSPQMTCDSNLNESKSTSNGNIQQPIHGSFSDDDVTDSINCPLENRFSCLPVDDDSVECRLYSDAARQPTVIKHDELHINQQYSKIPVMISDRKVNVDRKNDRKSYLKSMQKEQKMLQPKSTGTIIIDNDDDDDDEFTVHVRRRTKRFYVGGFLPSITEAILMRYAKRRGVKLSWVNIRRYESQNRAVIRVNVDSELGYRLVEDGFWPRGIVCRPWYSKGQYNRRYDSNYDDYDHDLENHCARGNGSNAY